MSDLTVACVLRSGGRYDESWVQRLRAGVSEHLSADHDFVCLSDRSIGREPIARYMVTADAAKWPGWWAKLALFRPGLFRGRVLYLDLDTDIVGSLDDLAGYDGDLALLSDFNRPERAQSGVMAWTAGPETESLFMTFASDADHFMREYRGDGEWLHDYVHHRHDRLQDLFPRQIVSWKLHCAKRVNEPGQVARYEPGAPPSGARVVCYHGEPKRDTLGTL